LKHLLTITLLFDSWDDFVASYRNSTEQQLDAPCSLQPAGRGADDMREANFLDEIRRSNASVSTAARSVGVTTSTGVRWAKRAGIDFVKRPKVWNDDRLQKVRRFLLLGLSKLEVHERTGMSAVSLNRLLSSEPGTSSAWRAAREVQMRAEKRRSFLAVIAAHPGWPVKAIRAIPGNGYAWLYRHDRAWLSEHLPAIWSAAARP
jgi:transposase